MPQLKQPSTLFTITSQVTATCIRTLCDSFLRHHGNVTHTSTIQQLESLNKYLLNKIPVSVLEQIRILLGLSPFIYFNFSSLRIDKKTKITSPMLHHIIDNVLPRMRNVAVLDLSKVQGNYELFYAVSTNCQQLKSIYVNTRLGYSTASAYGMGGEDWERWLLLLTKCKKLQIIHDNQDYSSFIAIGTSCITRILSELPALKVFNCFGMCRAFFSEELRSLNVVYQLVSLIVEEGFLRSAEEAHWLSAHCPHLETVTWRIDETHDYDRVLLALAESELKIESWTFSIYYPEFSVAMKTFFKAKGKYIHTLHLNYDSDCATPQLSYGNMVHISQSCPALKILTLETEWYNGETLLVDQTRTVPELFSGLVQLNVVFASEYRQVVERILRGSRQLKRLTCIVYEGVYDFVTMFKTIDNEFQQLTYLELVYVDYGEESHHTALKMFIKATLPVAMNWPNIQRIVVRFPRRIPYNARQYVMTINALIQMLNLDLVIDLVNDRTDSKLSSISNYYNMILQ